MAEALPAPARALDPCRAGRGYLAYRRDGRRRALPGRARWVYNNEPTKFAAIELVPKTSSDVPETLFGHLNAQGQVVGGFPIPGLASWLSDPTTGKNTVVQGLDATPENERPTNREVNVVHLAWDIMVGLGTLLFLLSAWYGLTWLFRRRIPRSKVFLWIASAAGVAAIVAMEAGWVVTEVGRWLTFVLVTLIYLAVGITLVVILRSMARRWRAQRDLGDDEVPYGLRQPIEALLEPTSDGDERITVGSGDGSTP